jgi:hypothetical protein
MKHSGNLAKALLMVSCSMGMLHAATVTQTLGASAGFADGSTNARTASWNTATAGNASPFNGFNGSDTTGTDFSASWTFGYGSVSGILSATLMIGIYDIDSAASGNQVGAYTEGSHDLTSLLNAQSEALNGNTGAVNNEYDILTITLPVTTFADLALGDPSFALSLVGPGLGALGNTTSNGAGIDFATITIQTGSAAPEPATWVLMLAGLGGIAGRKWLLRRP